MLLGDLLRNVRKSSHRSWQRVTRSHPYCLFNNTCHRYPVAIAASISVVRYTSMDGIVQFSESKSWSNWEFGRSGSFALFGLYIGAFFGVVYTKYYGRLLESLRSRGFSKFTAAFGISLLDVTVASAIAYYPVYYLLQEYCHTGQLSFTNALKRTKQNMSTDLSLLFLFYCPMSFVMLFWIPKHLRAVYASVVPSTFWSAIMSKMRGQYEPQVVKNIVSL
jgi:hypothetical protein